MTAPFVQMALNNAYANRTLYGAILDLDHAAFIAPRPGFFPSLSKTLNHIYEVDLFYIDALEEGGLGRSVYNRADIEDVKALARAQADADLRLAVFCGSGPDGSKTVNVERKALMTQEKIGALLPHLLQHQVHHRGQAHVQISDAGLAPPQLDDFFLEHDRAHIAKEYFA